MTKGFDHLDPATIAALIDRTLDPAARAAAEAHLAGCADCREVWVETSEISAETQGMATTPATAPATVDARRRSGRSWIYAGAGLAAAVLIGVALLWSARANDADPLLAALQPASETNRFADGRLSVPLPWLPPPAETRGASGAAPIATVGAAARLRALADEQGSAASLQAAGIGMLAVGDRAEAVSLLLRASQLAPQDASVHSDLSAAYLEMWRFSAQTTYAARALDEAKRATLLDPKHLPSAFNLALALEAFGLRDEAQRAWDSYLALDATSPWADEARRRRSEGGAQAGPSLSDEYLELETQLLPAWASGGSVQPLRSALEQLGNGADGAIVAMTRAAAETGGLKTSRRACLESAALHIARWINAFESGQSTQALEAAHAAGRNLQCAGLPAADADARRAVSLLELSRFQEAEALASRVLNADGTEHYRRARARAWQIRGLAAYQRAEFSNALEAAHAAAQEAALGRDFEFHAALTAHVADLLSIQGDVAGAWQHLAVAVAGVEHMRSPRRRYSTLARASVNALELRLPGAGLVFADAVIRSSADWSNPVGRAFGYLKRAEALGALERPELVPSNVTFARTLAGGVTPEAVRDEIDAQGRTTQALLAPSPDPATRAGLDTALTHFERTGNRIMQAPVLLARGRWKAGHGETASAEQDWRRGLEIIEDERPQIRDAQLQVSRLDRVWELYEELIDLVVRRDPEAALAISERGRARQLLDALSRTTHPRRPLEGSAMRTWLPAGVRALVYASLPDRLIVWNVDAKGITFVSRAVSRRRLDHLVDLHVGAVRSGAASESLQELSDLLLPRDTSGRGTLLVLPDGPLYRVPFSTLKTSAGHHLAEEATVVIAPSLTAAQAVSTGPHQGRLIPLLVGSSLPAPESGLPRLAGVIAEISMLRSQYPASTVLLDDEAEPAAVLQAMAAHSIFHFAGHALADPVHPRRSRLIMSSTRGERSLSAAEISGAGLKPGTVVILAACDTANGEIYRGEGVMALSRAFVEAGAAAVVGTLWKIDDKQSKEFLSDFHRAFIAERSAPEALARTQRAWLSSKRSAAVWAAFQVTGGL